MDDRVFGVIANGVWEYLDELTARAHGERGPLAPEVRRLVASWQVLLRLHGCGRHRCAVCGHGRWPAWLRGRSRHPDAASGELCVAWQVAIAYFIRRLPPGS